MPPPSVTTITGSTTVTGGALTTSGKLINNGTITETDKIAFGVAVSGTGATVVNTGIILNAYDSGQNNPAWAVGFTGGGQVFNEAGGTIRGFNGVQFNDAGYNDVDSIANYLTNAAGGTIIGAYFGVSGYQHAVTVVNAGSIISTEGTANAGVFFAASGTVHNRAGGFIGALNDAVVIVDSGARNGVSLVQNDAGGTITAGYVGVGLYGNPATVTNAGLIRATGTIGAFGHAYPVAGVILNAGGALTNQSGGRILATTGDGVDVRSTNAATIINEAGGTISGYDTGVYMRGGAATVVNAGSISGSLGIAFWLGGSVTNQSGGTIGGYSSGVYITGSAGTVVNAGRIFGENFIGIVLKKGGSITNQSGGTISGYYSGVYIAGSAGTVVNAGGISGENSSGIVLRQGGSITNQSGGTIYGYNSGVYITGSAGTVVNTGSISGANFYGIWLRSGGSVTNQSGGTISGYNSGVYIAGSAGTVVNAGTISGGPYSVKFAAGQTNRLIIDPGAVFNGIVDGGVDGGGATLELESKASAGTISGLGDQFIHFDHITVDSGAAWTISGSNTLAAGQDLINAGVLTNTGTLYTEGALIDKGTLINRGTIAETDRRSFGIAVAGSAATVVNSGLIENAYTTDRNDPNFNTPAWAVGFDKGGQVFNEAGGTITGFSGVKFDEANFGDVDSFPNYVSNATGGSIIGAYFGVAGYRNAVTVSNAGSIVSTLGKYNAGIYLSAGGSVHNFDGGFIGGYGSGLAIANNRGENTGFGIVQNDSGGTITGGYAGIGLYGNPSTVTNAGLISATGTQATSAGVVFCPFSSAGGGTITNLSGGVIRSTTGDGVAVRDQHATTIINRAGGTITGGRYGVYGTVSADLTVTNAGTIGGTTDAIKFASGGTDRLIVDAGAVFNGIVDGGGATLELESKASAGTISGFGSQFIGFDQITIDSGAAWTLTGANNTLDAGTTLTNAGTLTLDSATLAGSAAVVNNGTILLDPSNMTVASLTGIGTVEIDAGSTLSVTGTISAGETIILGGTNAVLALGDAAGSGLTIDGFQSGDAIDLTSIAFTAGDTAYMSGTTLMLAHANSALVASFKTADIASSKRFLVVDDGNGGEKIILNAPSVALANDTGNSPTDRITSVNALTVSSHPGAFITLNEGTRVLGTQSVNASGTWSFTPTSMTQGAHTIVASETYSVGDVSTGSLTFTYDTVAPALTSYLTNDPDESSSEIESATAYADEDYVNLDVMSGKGDAGGVVTLKDGTTVLGTTTADANGSWSFTPPSLSDGMHTILATETDIAGNASTASLFFVYDTVAPLVSARLATDTGLSSSDKVTSVATLTGTGDTAAIASVNGPKTVMANAIVRLTEGTSVLGTTTANASGSWSFTPRSLAQGTHTIIASETDFAGNVGTASLSFTYDSVAPTVTEALGTDTGRSNTDRVTSNATLTGGGDPNAVVTLKEGAVLIGTAIANGSGAWSFTPGGLAQGSHTILASETDLAGKIGTASLSFTYDTSAPAVTALLLNDTGTAADKKTSIAALTGSGDANAVVTLSEGGTILGTATAKASGTWSFTPKFLAAGTHTIVATETDAAGTVGTASLGFTYTPAASGYSVAPNASGLAALQGASGLNPGILATLSQIGGNAGDPFSYSLAVGSSPPLALSTAGVLSVRSGGMAGAPSGKVYMAIPVITDTASGVSKTGDRLYIAVGDARGNTVSLQSLGIDAATPTFVYGLGGADTLTGAGMTSKLWFVGGAGADTMTGGSGVNTYLYGSASESTASSMDIIVNFDAGKDLINLAGLGGTLAYVGSLSGSLAAHSVGWKTADGKTDVYVNTSGSSNNLADATMKIELNGAPTLSSTNFTLV